jgi:WD40 repeat protein
LEGPGFCVRGLAFNSIDGTLAAGGDDLAVFIWRNGATTAGRFPAHELEITSLVFTADGRYLLTASADKTFCAWEWARGLLRLAFQREAHERGVCAIDVDSSGELIATGSSDCSIRTWSFHEPAPLQTLSSHTDKIRVVRFAPDTQTLVSGGEDGTIRTWNCRADTSRPAQREPVSNVLTGAIYSDGTIAVTAHAGRAIVIRDVHGDRIVDSWTVDDTITAIALSLDASGIIWGTDQGDVFWRPVAAGQAVKLGPSIGSGAVHSVRFSGDGLRVISAGPGRYARVWEIDRCQLLAELQLRQNEACRTAALDWSGTSAALGGYGRVEVWDVAAKALRHELAGFVGDVIEVSFSDDGLQIDACTKYSIRVRHLTEANWSLLPRGGPAVAVANPNRFPLRIVATATDCAVASTSNHQPVRWFPAVPSMVDVSASSSPIVLMVEDGGLQLLEWMA